MLDNKYRILRVLGVGGMGTVYEAEHVLISRRVAIKVLASEFASRPDAVERFFREAKAASAIGHPNIINIYDVGREEDGTVYLVMERLEGRNLCDHIQAEGRLSPSLAIAIAAQVLSGLRSAHEKGIIHRDLKADNVFLALDARGRQEAKLLDFGIAKMGPVGSLGLTRDGDVVGTPYYLSPEQARGGRGVDERIDIWGVGVLLYEMLSGALPFTGENYNEVLGKILLEEPVPLSERVKELPKALAAIVDKAMQKDREHRFPTAGAMLDALLPLLGSAGDPLLTTSVVEILGVKRALPNERQNDPLLRTSDIEVLSDGPWGDGEKGIPPRKVALVAAAIAIGIAIAAAAVLVLVFKGKGDLASSAKSRSADVRPPVARASEPTPTPIETVTITLDGLPEGARISLDGISVSNPISRPKSEASAHFEIAAPGYAALDLPTVFDHNQRIAVEMRSLDEAARGDDRNAKVETAPAKGTEKKSGSKRGKKKKAGWESNPFD